jgi:uncharacterized membrane protein YeaQ/YmgE (transglycosylase-associated protein family)
MLLTIMSWLLFGLVVGAIARLLYPGRQAMGIFATMALGVVGSLLGGLVSWGIFGGEGDRPFDGAGWIMSIIGALVVVWGALAMSRRGTTVP